MPINTNYAEKMYASAGGRVPPTPVEQVGVAGLTLKAKEGRVHSEDKGAWAVNQS